MQQSLADCTESTLGAAYLSVGIDGALRVGTALGLPIGGSMPWNLRKQPDFLEANGIALLFAPVEETLGYKFVNPSLVVEAFTHTAYDLSLGPSYNRLEFLGDCTCDKTCCVSNVLTDLTYSVSGPLRTAVHVFEVRQNDPWSNDMGTQ